MLIRALRFAQRAHRDQLDEGGRDYFTAHVLDVVRRVDGDARVIAALHDVVADTPVTSEYLRMEFDGRIGDAVDALTRQRGEDYFDYIERVKENELARVVKLAELESDLSKDRGLVEEECPGTEVYNRAKAILES